jgi:hypothetical protein
VRFTVQSSSRTQSFEFSYQETNTSGQSQGYLDAPLEPGNYYVEWGVPGAPPIATGYYALSCD